MRANTAGTIFKIVAVIALLGSIGGFFLDYVTGITGFEIFRATMEVNYGWTETIMYLVLPHALLIIAALVLVGSTSTARCIITLVLSVIAFLLYMYGTNFDFSFKYRGMGFIITFIACLCGIVFPILILTVGVDRGRGTYTMEDDYHNNRW
ncbi:MAG: hypothetical protein IJM62_00725 [Lachnospiraceae bacterium]|nr:hypothetical protein [Lachnospiraceae bacterium]